MRAETFTKTILAFFAFFIVSNTSHAQCDWEPIGLDNDMFFIADSSTTYRPAIAADNAGIVYTAFCDAQNSAKATVKRYVNGYWSLMGNAGFSDGRVDKVKIAIDNLNHVFVAYEDYAYGRKVTVKYYNGFSWVNIGVPGFSPVKVDDLDLTIDQSNNRPYVTFADSTNKVSVMSFFGTAWSNVGATGFSVGIVANLGIVANANTPYVVYNDYGAQNKMRVMKYDGAAWDSLGSTSTFMGGQPSIVLDNNNVVHVVFQDVPMTQASVIYYNGGAWDYLGGPNVSSTTAIYTNLAFDASNNAYVSCTTIPQQRGELIKYNGSSWSVLGQMYVAPNQSIPNQYARFNGIAINSATQEPYMMYTQNNATPLLGMKDFGVVKWTGTQFKNTNGTSITSSINFNTGGYYATFNYDPFGTPYVVYTDSVNGNRCSVKKFDGTNWVQVGNAGFSTYDVEFNSIDFDASGTPYVAFREQTSSPSVMKFNGTAWVYVGAPMFYVAANGVYTSMAVNPVTNEPYIFFNDATVASRGTCMRFDGSNWVNVGTPGFTAGGVGWTTIKFNPTGTPYVAYPDNAYASKLAMMKFNGTSWVAIGSGAITTAQVFSYGFALDASDNIYLTYTDVSQSYKVTCKKWDGTAWANVGGYLNTGYASDCDVTVDAFGNVFIYYTDQFLNYYPGTVKRWFNNTWVTVGRQQIFNGTTQTNTIRTHPITGLAIIGSLLQGNWGEGKGYYMKSLPCNFNTAIAGNTFYDADSDCAFTVGDVVLPNTPIQLTQGPNTSLTFTDNGGNYYFTAMPAGTYTIGTGNLQNGYNIQCANSQPHATVVTANALNTEDFAIACTPEFDFIAASISPIGAWWPGQYVWVKPNAPVQRTICSGTPTPGTITMVFPPCLNYIVDTTLQIQPNTVIDDANGDTLIYNIPDVYNYPPFFLNSMYIRAQICTTATSGDTLCIQLIVNANNDVDVTNNTYTRCVGIASSFDPNNKEVNPRGTGTSGIIPDTTVGMVYTINFQNTGTAPAVNIVVKDTLSSNLQLETFQIVGSSHAMSGTNITNGVVSFNFPNIMLPDSTSDELNSHGFVTYKIDLVPNLAPLTQIKNTAYIYFDYNEAIITNTAINTIEEPLGISVADAATPFAIYPNPAMDFVSIYTTANYKQAQLMIYNLTGQLITQKQITQANQIPITELGNGMYIFVVQNGDTVIGRQRVVVVR